MFEYPHVNPIVISVEKPLVGFSVDFESKPALVTSNAIFQALQADRTLGEQFHSFSYCHIIPIIIDAFRICVPNIMGDENAGLIFRATSQNAKQELKRQVRRQIHRRSCWV